MKSSDIEILPNNTLLCLLHNHDIDHALSSFPITWSLKDRNEAIGLILKSREPEVAPLDDDDAKNIATKRTDLYKLHEEFLQRFPNHKLSKKSLLLWTVRDHEIAKRLIL